MNTITLKSVEPQLVQRLQKLASKNGRTIEAEIASILSSVLILDKNKGTIDADGEVDLATAISRRFAPLGGFDLPETPRIYDQFMGNTKL